MSNQLELAADERSGLGKRVRRLRREGMVPANMYGHGVSSVSLQVNALALKKLLGRGGNNVILLNFANKPSVQVLIKQLQRDFISGDVVHVEFYRVGVGDKLKTTVPLHYVNEAAFANLSDVIVSHVLSEVMVECLPADLPSSIEVDLSQLSEVGAMIRVGNLVAGPGVTILTDPNETVAGVRQRVRSEAEKVAAAEATPASS